jgi:poly(3-hydroxybutyrate) depolymerase
MVLARLGAATMLTLSLAGQRPPASRVDGDAASVPILEARHAAIEQRLDRIAGHESTKATIRYPLDLLRVVALGRRPLPGQADHFDLEGEFARSEELLRALESGRDPLWRATGDHARHYPFAAADEILPYRLYVPTTWDGRAALPLVLMLHGGGATENTNMDNDDGALPKLAERRGFIVVCPLGYRPTGAFGNRARAFGPTASRGSGGLAADLSRDRETDLSEQDALNVLSLVTAEYGADPWRMYLAGHSMGSGGAWHLAAKDPARWAAVAPMSGPFVDDAALESLRDLPIFMTDGSGSTGTIESSRALQRYLKAHGYAVTYLEVEATHLGMVPLVLPRVFDFFAKHRRK